MPVFVSLLRGVNVGGHHEIKMSALQDLYGSIGLRHVTTFIRSGNIIFQTPERDPSSLEILLEKSIEEKFGIGIAVIIRSPARLARIVRQCPYARRKGIDINRLAVSFLKSRPVPAFIRAMKALPLKNNDEYVVSGDVIYLHCPRGFARTGLTGAFFERHLHTTATARNWKTTLALTEMSRGLNA
jgi:uncharacterized protein (DUF1697 family)